MARILEQFVAEPRACSYLPDETAALEYRLMLDVSPGELDGLLERGWRRFGVAYFRPRCAACQACVPLRIPVDRFHPGRGHRRVLRAGRDLRLTVGVPVVDEARLALYDRWHAGRSERRGWAQDQMTAERYFHEFAFPHPAARELAWWTEDGQLVAVSLVDETDRALSAVYTYHDPELTKRSLGTLSILTQVDLARRAKKRWVYLGYRVLGCASSEYKARFLPHELMTAWSEDNPTWSFVTST
ncbi:MAG: arginyltransferase [Myxococcota bacterium]